MEGQLMVCYEVTFLVPWLRNFILGLQILNLISKPMWILYDNCFVVFLLKNNNKSSSKSTIINRKYFTVRRNNSKSYNVNETYQHIGLTNLRMEIEIRDTAPGLRERCRDR